MFQEKSEHTTYKKVTHRRVSTIGGQNISPHECQEILFQLRKHTKNIINLKKK